jgi:PAS domain S-box-containing protein
LDNLDLHSLAAQVQQSNHMLEQAVSTDDGQHYLLRIRPYQISPNHFSGVVLTFFDITELRRTEKDLVERDARMKSLLNTITDGYVLTDIDCTILEINREIERITGYSEKELIGQNVKLLMPENTAEQHAGYVHQYLDGGQAAIIGRPRHLQMRLKDGSPIPILLTLNEIKEGGRHLFVGLIRAEETISHAEEAS